MLKNSVSELDKFCREEKGVNPDDAAGLVSILHFGDWFSDSLQ
jgi:hypothetical protein